jgi:kynurenine formamidase
MVMDSNSPNDEYDRWIDELATRSRFGAGDRRGTANFIDAAARLRAAEAIQSGACISLARPVVDETDGGSPAVVVEVSHSQINAFANRPAFSGRPVDTGGDVMHIRAHGQTNTHLDAINHIGRGGTWYSGFAVEDPEGPSLVDIANHCLFTRAVLVDIPAVRGTPWVDADRPVTGEDIDAALGATGTQFEPGDALLLYMGRDRFEAEGGRMDVATGEPTPGAGASAARWVAAHDVSLLCWDFLDAVLASEPVFQLHLLIWAIGLLLVDNSDLAVAAQRVRQSGRATGALVVAPAAIPRATGSLVQPLFIQ